MFKYQKYVLGNNVCDNYSRVLTLKDLIENASYNKLKVNCAIRDLEEMEDKYGKFIFNKFQNVITIEKELDIIEEGNYNEFPTLKEINKSYFNLEKFIKNNN